MGLALNPCISFQGIVTVELCPGCGLLELYGRPGLYHLQDQSLLHSAELAKKGTYNAPDIFSGRKDRVLRALEALEAGSEPQLQVLLDDRVASSAEGSKFLALESTSSHPLLSLLGQILDSTGEAYNMLPLILRAQCAGDLSSQATQLQEILVKNCGPWQPKPEDIEIALARGFWSLPADQSGMHLREREADRLLDRAKREMWRPGSISRRELETQIRNFLCLHLLGEAACRCCMRFSFVRATPSTQDILSQNRFVPLQSAPGLWCRMEIAPLQLPPL
ncbi:unnamed protein product [Effrenium voratum]|nr:unnamed protein product [Effrenium voratum]